MMDLERVPTIGWKQILEGRPRMRVSWNPEEKRGEKKGANCSAGELFLLIRGERSGRRSGVKEKKGGDTG